MVKLRNVAKGSKANVFAKLEYLNPTGSLKDRVALQMIEQAEKEGKLMPGYTIVEASTGNTGTSLAFVGTLKGYRVKIFETTIGNMGKEKINLMRNYGAEVNVITPNDIEALKEKSVHGAEIELPGRRICLELEKSNSKIWWARQFSNPQNVRAHNVTGKEILEQTNGKVDAFVASIGTGGTLMGIAETLKEKLPNVKVIGVQPASSKTIKLGKPYARTEISGGIISDMLDKHGLIDEIVGVSDAEAIDMTHRLWQEEGLFAGVSSGANVLVALRSARSLARGRNVVTILPDSGDRYMTEEHYVT